MYVAHTEACNRCSLNWKRHSLHPEQSDPEAEFQEREPEKVAEKKRKLTLHTQGTWGLPEVIPSVFHLYKQYFLLLILTEHWHYKTEKLKILS